MKKLQLLLFLAVAAGCAGRSTTGSSAIGHRDRDVIGRDELLDPTVRSLTVLEAVRAVRPTYLTSRARGGQSLQDPEAGKVHASIDGISVVALDELRKILVTGVIEIRFLNEAAAMQRFGGAARQGPVILVKTM